jgi:hypothetical protein
VRPRCTGLAGWGKSLGFGVGENGDVQAFIEVSLSYSLVLWGLAQLLCASQFVDCVVTWGSGQVIVTGNVGKELEYAAERVVERAAAKVVGLPGVRLGPGLALKRSVDVHFSFHPAQHKRYNPNYALAMAAALYNALRGGTTREDMVLYGGEGGNGDVLTRTQEVTAGECRAIAALRLRGDIQIVVVEERMGSSSNRLLRPRDRRRSETIPLSFSGSRNFWRA